MIRTLRRRYRSGRPRNFLKPVPPAATNKTENIPSVSAEMASGPYVVSWRFTITTWSDWTTPQFECFVLISIFFSKFKYTISNRYVNIKSFCSLAVITGKIETLNPKSSTQVVLLVLKGLFLLFPGIYFILLYLPIYSSVLSLWQYFNPTFMFFVL